ncbi:hypothetical protein C7448_101773 [Tenacibaculum gallaicum]|uniref:Uncharacterized protein n=1 Tax=Tenacibaculum gallaicum TaxID=561505 RepID=A0A3E0IDA6_9FLAO|nr:hypothetical protein [Tenacibaculum gallaicum]REH56730.1 hypothetical protein C7448_101773 [Tenacibaculum gallaicum]
MNYFLKKMLLINDDGAKVLVYLIGLFISLIFLFSSFYFVFKVHEGENIKEKALYILLYLILQYFFNFFLKILDILRYIEAHNIKKEILYQKKIGKFICEWEYTYEEWEVFKEKHSIGEKKYLFYKIKVYGFITLICLILLFTFEPRVSTAFISIIVFLVIFFSTGKDYDSAYWEKALKKNNATLIFSKAGIVVSGIHVMPFNSSKNKLIDLRYDENNSSLIFDFSTLIKGTSGGIDDISSPDTVINSSMTFPVPERYKSDVDKLKYRINIFTPFRVKNY